MLGTAFRALRIPHYRLFWMGQLASQTGTWMQSVAQAWLVLRLTNSPLALGTVATVQFTPILLFSLLGGVLADRLPKRRLLMTTQTIMVAQATVMALLTWTGHIQLWQIYILAAVLGTANALDNPTRQSFVRELVPTEDLPNAIAINSMQFNLSRIAGPALAGLLISIVGVAGCFALNAISSMAVLNALRQIPPGPSAPRGHQRGNVLNQIGEGLRYATTTPDVALILALMAVIGTFGYNFNTVLPLIARYLLNANPLQFGALTTAMGIGSLLAAVGLAASGRATRQTLFIGATGFSLILAAVAQSRWWGLTIVLLVGLGVCSIAFSTTANTRLQLVTPPHLRGRVMSIYMLMFGGTTPIGSLLIGTSAQHLGVRFAVTSAATLCLIGVMGGWLFLFRQRRQQPTQVVGMAVPGHVATLAASTAPNKPSREETMSTSPTTPTTGPHDDSGARGAAVTDDQPAEPRPASTGRRLVAGAGLVALLLLTTAGLFGYRWWYDVTNYVRTDNAQIAGYLVQAGTLSPGRVDMVRYDVGDRVARDDVVATVHVPVSVTTSSGIVRQEYRATSDTVVEARAPIDGVIVARLVNPGDTIPAGQPLLTIVDPDQLWVYANIEETQIRRIRVGQPVTVSIDTHGIELEGRIATIRPASTTAISPPAKAEPGGTFTKVPQLVQVKIILVKPDPSLLVGTSVSVAIHVAP